MVHPLVISTGSKILRTGIAGVKVEGKFWQQFWKHPYDKAIRGSITAGGLLSGTNISNDNGIEPDALSQKNVNGNASNKSNQARSGRFKYNSSKFQFNSNNCRCHRYANSGRKRKRRNR